MLNVDLQYALNLRPEKQSLYWRTIERDIKIFREDDLAQNQVAHKICTDNAVMTRSSKQNQLRKKDQPTKFANRFFQPKLCVLRGFNRNTPNDRWYRLVKLSLLKQIILTFSAHRPYYRNERIIIKNPSSSVRRETDS